MHALDQADGSVLPAMGESIPQFKPCLACSLKNLLFIQSSFEAVQAAQTPSLGRQCPREPIACCPCGTEDVSRVR